jgi:hypothetical protein
LEREGELCAEAQADDIEFLLTRHCESLLLADGNAYEKTNTMEDQDRMLTRRRKPANRRRFYITPSLGNLFPNHMYPPQGYVPALKKTGDIVPSIHTFGFGCTLR